MVRFMFFESKRSLIVFAYVFSAKRRTSQCGRANGSAGALCGIRACKHLARSHPLSFLPRTKRARGCGAKELAPGCGRARSQGGTCCQGTAADAETSGSYVESQSSCASGADIASCGPTTAGHSATSDFPWTRRSSVHWPCFWQPNPYTLSTNTSYNG